MTFERRLQKLECLATARAEANQPNTLWLDAVAEPILRYFDVLADEYSSHVNDGSDSASAIESLRERHPLFRSVVSFLDANASVGEFPSLRRVQEHLLYIAGKHLPFYPWPDPRWQRWRLIGRDYTQHLCGRAALATSEEIAAYEVNAWRESGTTDAEVLAAAGIGALELELLAADG